MDGKQRAPKGQTAPDPTSLPVPPQIPQLPSPANVAMQEEAPSAAQYKLDALVAALRSSTNALPAEVVELLGEQAEAQTKDMSKAMHRAVNQKARASREIHRLRAARRSFLDAWARYTAHLTTTLEEQIKKQAEAMEEFSSREQSWQAKLAESNEQLARLSGDTQHITSDSDAEMDPKDRIAAAEEDPWASAAFADEQKKQQMQLLEALKKAQASAEQAVVSPKRERTPRRQKPEAVLMLAETKSTPKGEKEGADQKTDPS